MFAFFFSAILLFAESGGASAEGGFTKFYNDYLNYPGFEAWKFINLAIFVAALIYILKKPLGEAFKARRDAIRAELIKAEQEKQAALAELTTVEAKLAALESEKTALLKSARDEADAEKANILKQTEFEIAKMREQAENEIDRLVQQVKSELRRFSADESVRLAEEKLRGRINPGNDATLVKTGIQEIGGLN
jgi:F-type H+-transporting ATPase subunit b